MATAQMTQDRRGSASDLAKQQRRRIYRTAYLYILPAALIMLLITFWPLIYQLWMSFTELQQPQPAHRQPAPADDRAPSPGTSRPTTRRPGSGCRTTSASLNGDLGKVLTGFDFWRILLFNFVWTLVNVFFHVSIGVAWRCLLNQDGLIVQALLPCPLHHPLGAARPGRGDDLAEHVRRPVGRGQPAAPGLRAAGQHPLAPADRSAVGLDSTLRPRARAAPTPTSSCSSSSCCSSCPFFFKLGARRTGCRSLIGWFLLLESDRRWWSCP